MQLNWHDLSDAERDREYSPSSCLDDGDYRPYVTAYRTESVHGRAMIDAWDGADIHGLSYGDNESQTIDVAVPNEVSHAAPLLVFFHGGYWQELSKDDSFFPAWSAVQQGWAYAAVDYTLAPAASIDEIVDECRQAMRVLCSEAPALGLDDARFVVAGSSAGAHLAAMVALGSSHTVPLAGAVLVSGIYELEPLIGTSIDEALGLDALSARRNSPLLMNAGGFPPTVLAHGDNETSQFKAQTSAFAAHLESAGAPVVVEEIAGRNHFDVIMELAEPDTVLGHAVARLIDSGGTHAHL